MQHAVNQTQEKVGQFVDQAQETMGQTVDQVQQTAASRLTAQKDRAADGLVLVAQTLRQTGQELRGQDQAMISEYVDRAAQQVERFYRFLHARDVNEIVGEVEQFARRQPGLFLGSTFALGLLGARFLKSSDRRAPATMAGQAFQPRYPLRAAPPAGQSGTISGQQRPASSIPRIDTPGIGRTTSQPSAGYGPTAATRTASSSVQAGVTSPSSSNTVGQDRNQRGTGGQ